MSLNAHVPEFSGLIFGNNFWESLVKIKEKCPFLGFIDEDLDTDINYVTHVVT